MKTLKNGVIVLLILTIAVLITVFVCNISFQQKVLSDKLIRLHIISNSNNEADQQMKLDVRDDVNEYVSQLLYEVDSKDDALNILESQLDEIKAIAENSIINCGAKYNAAVELSEEYYPTREYESFSLPAGKYTSMQIKIGNAEGKNWWCVVFPPVCTNAASADVLTEMDFSDDEINLITSEDEDVIFKFKVLEILGVLKDVFSKSDK